MFEKRYYIGSAKDKLFHKRFKCNFVILHNEIQDFYRFDFKNTWNQKLLKCCVIDWSIWIQWPSFCTLEAFFNHGKVIITL